MLRPVTAECLFFKRLAVLGEVFSKYCIVDVSLGSLGEPVNEVDCSLILRIGVGVAFEKPLVLNAEAVVSPIITEFDLLSGDLNQLWPDYFYF